MIFVRVLLVLMVAGFFASSPPALATELVPVNVKDRVILAVPPDWTISDAAARKKVVEVVQETMAIQGNLASFSAQSYPRPSTAMIRVSFLPLDSPITQAQLRGEVAKGKADVIRNLAESWEEQSALMWASLAKVGVRPVGSPRFDVVRLGGLLAMVIEYGRTSRDGTPSMLVTQYHVPMGSEKALITLSRTPSDAGAV